jgi:2-amino-4-hydroxy-6-hydroxymethyldihydropteridine diphosphokinase
MSTGVRACQLSGFHETRPIGGPGQQGAFLNAACLLDVDLSPEDLLRLLLDTERQLGRQRGERWQARTIDLDLLLYNDLVCESPALTVPHPRMSFRRFVLLPALEVAADLQHPTIGWSLRRLVDYLDQSPPYIAITGPPGTGKTELARAVQREGPGVIRLAQTLEKDTPTGRSDSPSADLRAQLELLAYRTQRLAELVQEQHDWIISDFWCDQSLVYMERFFEQSSCQIFAKAWQTAQNELPRPKLRVLLTRNAEGDALESEFVRQASRPHQGPLLKLTNASPEWAKVEVIAAMEAMSESTS